jgi:CRP-like cAMP-binding protein
MQIKKALPAKKIRKKNLFIFQGEIPRSGYQVVQGFVKAYNIDNGGNEQIVDLYGEGDIFPIDWLMSEVGSAAFYYESITEMHFYTISKSELQNIYQYDAERTMLLKQLQNEVRSKTLHTLALQQQLATNKIVYFFYYIAMRFGKEIMKGMYNLRIPLTHQMISECLGITRETTAAELSKLKKTGAITYKNKQYVVNKKLLMQTVGKDISGSLTSAEHHQLTE